MKLNNIIQLLNTTHLNFVYEGIMFKDKKTQKSKTNLNINAKIVEDLKFGTRKKLGNIQDALEIKRHELENAWLRAHQISNRAN